MQTTVIVLELKSEYPISDQVAEELKLAVAEIAGEVLEANNLIGKIAADVGAYAYVEAKVIGGEPDEEKLTPPVAALFGALEKDEYGATKGCDCDGCKVKRARARWMRDQRAAWLN